MIAKKRSIVTNYLFRSTKDKQQLVALFHRNNQADFHSYHGFYAPISCIIGDSDTDPLTVAERVFSEETGLKIDNDVELAFAGQPFTPEGPVEGREWTVNPFGWNLLTTDGSIKLRSNHDSWKWFDLQDILNGTIDVQVIPALYVSLQRVSLGPGGMFRNGDWLVERDSESFEVFSNTMHSLRNNTTDGARVLANDALRGLCKLAKSFKKSILEKDSSNEYWYVMRVAAYHFIYSARPSMNAAIGTALVRALGEISQTMSAGQLRPDDAIKILQRHIEARDQITLQISTSFSVFIHQQLEQVRAAKQIPTKEQTSIPEIELEIFTLSASSTVKIALKHFFTKMQPNGVTMKLIVLESRPAFEGADMVAALFKELEKTKQHDLSNLKVGIYPESHASLLLQPVSSQRSGLVRLVVLGADRITSTGHVINKTGSAMLANLAHFSTTNTKVVILSEEDKIAGPELRTADDFSKFIGSRNINQIEENDAEVKMLRQAELNSMRYEHHDSSEIYKAWSQSTQETLKPYLKTNAGIQLTIENIYFEPIRAEHIDTYLSENGEMSRMHILKTSSQRVLIENAIFGGLYD